MHLSTVSQLFIRNASIKFTGSFVNAGNAINIPALTQSRNFLISNLRINNNFDHLITSSPYLKNFNLYIKNGIFAHFLNSPIFIRLGDGECEGYSGKDYEKRPQISQTFYYDKCVNVTVVNCNFSNCETRASSGTPDFSANGGAIAIIKENNKIGTLLNVTDCSFTNCCVTTTVPKNGGGAIYVKNIIYVKINNCQFEVCNVSYSGKGGAICVDNCREATIKHSSFDKCTTPEMGNGGGIAFQNVLSVYTNYLTFSDCASSYYGGGIFCFNVNYYYFLNISFIKCISDNGQGSALAVNIDDTNPTVTTTMEGEYIYVEECNNYSALAFGLVAFLDVRYINLLNSSATYPIFMLFSYGNISFLTFKGNTFNKYCQIMYTNETTRSYPRKYADGITNPLLSISCALVKYDNYTGSFILYFKGLLTVSVEDLAINISNKINNSLAVISSTLNTVAYDDNFTCLNTPATNMFSNSVQFSASNGFSETSNFSQSDILPSRIVTFSQTFSDSFKFIALPERTTLLGNEAYGTVTDMGMVSGVVVAVILLIVLIIIITLCIIKSRQTLMMIEEKEVHDEFYFPDFENRNV